MGELWEGATVVRPVEVERDWRRRLERELRSRWADCLRLGREMSVKI